MVTLVEKKTIARYIGLSTDDKPLQISDAVGIPNGSQFLEMDTGKKYYYDGDLNQWSEIASSDDDGGGDDSGGGGETSDFRSIDVVVNQHYVFPDEGDGYVVIDSSTVSGMSYSELFELGDGETVIMSSTVNTTYPNVEEPETEVLKRFTTKMMMNSFPSLVGLNFSFHPRDYVFNKAYTVYEFELSGEDDLAVYAIQFYD